MRQGLPSFGTVWLHPLEGVDPPSSLRTVVAKLQEFDTISRCIRCEGESA